MRPFIGVICWQECSARYLCVECWPRCAIQNCVPVSMQTIHRSEITLLHSKALKSFLCIVMMKASFWLLTGRNEEGRNVQLVLQLPQSPCICWAWLAALAPVKARFLWPRGMLSIFFGPGVLSYASLEDFAACWSLTPSIIGLFSLVLIIDVLCMF